LANYQVNDNWLNVYIKALVPSKNEKEVSTRTINIRDGIGSRFESESNSKSSKSSESSSLIYLPT